jgi:hypothetical protein
MVTCSSSNFSTLPPNLEYLDGEGARVDVSLDGSVLTLTASAACRRLAPARIAAVCGYAPNWRR